MENDIQSMFPVYFPRKDEGGDLEEQNNRIAQNENNVNQNFAILYQKLVELAAQIT